MPRTGKRGIIAEMKLFKHAEFEQAVLQAAEHFRARGLHPAVIEKDYFVAAKTRNCCTYGLEDASNALKHEVLFIAAIGCWGDCHGLW
jgi:hypothetical protein